ncbi:MAG TPA: protein kinase [Gemmatimonadaceae bacterium]|nr:protein kinase [Gemmatimonadaceae bacterium]
MDDAGASTSARFADATLRRLRDALADRYELLGELGRGGMATVYVARDRKHEREVALKVMDPSLARGVGATRFLREVRIAATLTHPGIVPVFDSGEVDDTFYYVMPLLRGASLRERMREGPIAPREACGLLAEVADALDAAHRANIVHRDVKPENILLLDGRPLVTDFGVAHAAHTWFAESLTDTGAAVGTVLYMAPEQLFGAADIDGRADVFSVGAVLYEILSGTPPFSALTAPAAMARLAAEPTPALPMSLPVSQAVREAVTRATAREREERFATAHELAEALRNAALAEPVASGTTTRAATAPPRRLPRRAGTIAAGAVLVAAGAIAGVVAHRRETPDGTAGAAPSSLAVLSFANVSGDPKLAYFSDGVAQELQGALAEVAGLRVASRTAAEAWRGRSADPREIARALGVTDLLEGGVARTEDSVRLYVRLVDGRTGAQRWSRKFDRRLADVFDVQEEVARAVVRELRVALVGNAAAPIVRSRTASLEAHDLVLRANYVARTMRGPQLEQAVALADSAIALDSTYAPAWATKARALNLLAVVRDRTAPDVPRQARDAAARAVALDSLSADAQTSYGVLLFRHDWRWADAEGHLRRAIALNPTFVEAHTNLARVLRSLGRFAEARTHHVEVNRIDPDRPAGMALGRVSYFARDYERAIREIGSVPDTGQRFYWYWLGEAYLASGRLAVAESLFALDSARNGVEMSMTKVLAATGRTALARRMTADAERNSSWTLEEIGEAYIALGERSRALDVLERAVAQHDPLVVDFLVRPGLDPLRTEPRFEALMRRLAFPAPARFER